MKTTRRQFTIGALTAAAAGSMPLLVQAQSGKTIAVLDTGVDRFHPFLGGRVVEEYLIMKRPLVEEDESSRNDPAALRGSS